jgi:hypothetical protein
MRTIIKINKKKKDFLEFLIVKSRVFRIISSVIAAQMLHQIDIRSWIWDPPDFFPLAFNDLSEKFYTFILNFIVKWE